jgi:hypothetical protein
MPPFGDKPNPTHPFVLMASLKKMSVAVKFHWRFTLSFSTAVFAKGVF